MSGRSSDKRNYLAHPSVPKIEDFVSRGDTCDFVCVGRLVECTAFTHSSLQEHIPVLVGNGLIATGQRRQTTTKMFSASSWTEIKSRGSVYSLMNFLKAWQ